MRKRRDFGVVAAVYLKRPFSVQYLNAGYAPKYPVTAFYEVQGGPGPTPTDVPPSDRGCAPYLRAFSSRG